MVFLDILLAPNIWISECSSGCSLCPFKTYNSYSHESSFSESSQLRPIRLSNSAVEFSSSRLYFSTYDFTLSWSSPIYLSRAFSRASIEFLSSSLSYQLYGDRFIWRVSIYPYIWEYISFNSSISYLSFAFYRLTSCRLNYNCFLSDWSCS